MIRFHRSHLQPIGLDLGHDSIKMLQLEVSNGALAVVAAAREPMPRIATGAKTLESRFEVIEPILRKMIRRGGFSGRRVVVALPRDILHVKNLRLPQMPPHELEAAIQLESQNLFGFDSEEARLHYLPAGEVRQGLDVRQELIVLAARNDQVTRFLEQLHRCGLDVESFDTEPCALFRGVERFIRRRQDENEVHVLVDVGARRSQVIIGKGRDITFYKPIDVGGAHLQEAVSKRLSLSGEEASALRRRLADSHDSSTRRDPVRQAVFDATRGAIEELGREISLCLRYYAVTFRGQRPSRLRLVGGEASGGQLQHLLAASLAIPVETTRPLFSVDTSRLAPADRHGMMCEWAMAFGLSLRLTKGTFKPRDGKPRDPNDPVEIPPAPTDAADAPGAEATSAPSPAQSPASSGTGVATEAAPVAAAAQIIDLNTVVRSVGAGKEMPSTHHLDASTNIEIPAPSTDPSPRSSTPVAAGGRHA